MFWGGFRDQASALFLAFLGSLMPKISNRIFPYSSVWKKINNGKSRERETYWRGQKENPSWFEESFLILRLRHHRVPPERGTHYLFTSTKSTHSNNARPWTNLHQITLLSPKWCNCFISPTNHFILSAALCRCSLAPPSSQHHSTLSRSHTPLLESALWLTELAVFWHWRECNASVLRSGQNIYNVCLKCNEDWKSSYFWEIWASCVVVVFFKTFNLLFVTDPLPPFVLSPPLISDLLDLC